jgi:hypothetical protein
VGDPKSGTFSCVSPCVGELVLIVWPGAGRHMPSVRWQDGMIVEWSLGG